ncbi:uncharacterized protein LOC116119443 [Pistacia vera]|uniref:uncharacterized protein LOC116119443 n=1 Tax=Pistacia vera TaxID=55513 RepID=UPI001263628D|nr:uncharacterized protein LOC116119443 [Pistacia vera]
MAKETKRPARDILIGLVGSMSMITVIYCLMALALTMVVKYTQIDINAAYSVAFEQIGMKWAKYLKMECAFVGKFCNTLLVNSRRLKIKRRAEMRSHSKFYSFKFKITSVLSQANHNPSLQVATEKQGSPAGFGLGEWVWPSPGDEIPFWMNKFPSTDLSPEVSADIEKDSNLLHIIHVTAEMAPIAKVGGLGDVVTGLARACLSCGHTVDVMLPFYECIQRQEINDLELITTYYSYHDGDWVPIKAYRGLVSGVPVIFVESSNQFFKGQYVYGGSYNELEAYLFLSRACLEWMQVTGVHPDIIHVHEWQTGALPLLYWDMYHVLSLKKPRIVLTIHNMEHYGECRKEQLGKCGLDGSIYGTEDKAVDDRTIGHNPERLSLLKGGIVYSNAVITVSPTYLKETLCSGWLASTLISNRDKYFGILNGIDTVIWNPATDVFLPAKFHGSHIRRENGGHVGYKGLDTFPWQANFLRRVLPKPMKEP